MEDKWEPTLVIEAGKTDKQYFKDLWHYRELLYFLAWRDILVRYKQTVLGIAWSIIRPLFTMIIFTVVFGNLAKMPSGGIPYPILVFTAMLPWQLFANSVSDIGNSLIANANMISKVYFPRLIIPVNSIIVNMVDFLISCVILALLMMWYNFIPIWRILFLPLFIILAILASLGLGLWISALNVRFRDFRYIIPFIIQLGLYISPVGFSSNVIPEEWRLIYSINPMVGVIDGFRWSIIGKGVQLYIPGFVISIILSIALFVIAIIYFRKTEKTFADMI